MTCKDYIDPFMTVLVADSRANILDSRDTWGAQLDEVQVHQKWQAYAGVVLVLFLFLN